MSIIAEVVQAYGRYDAGLERRYIAERQKPAPPRQVLGVAQPRRVLSIQEELLDFFRVQDSTRRGWSQVLLADAVGRTRDGIHKALMQLVSSGLVEPQYVRQESKYGARVLYQLTDHGAAVSQEQERG